MMAHGNALLAFVTRPAAPVCEDARVLYQRRRIAMLDADLETVNRAARALLTELYPLLPMLPAAWDELADVTGWTKNEMMHG